MKAPCLACGRVAPGQARRGLCDACYRRESRRGGLAAHPSRRKAPDWPRNPAVAAWLKANVPAYLSLPAGVRKSKQHLARYHVDLVYRARHTARNTARRRVRAQEGLERVFNAYMEFLAEVPG